MESPLRGRVPGGTCLIETFGYHPGSGVRYAARHQARLARSAAALGFPIDKDAIAQAMAIKGDVPLRCRLTLDAAGRVDVTTAPMAATAAEWRVAISPTRLRADDPWLQIKSTNRAVYDDARATLPGDLDEWLFLNDRGEVCEGTITNLFAQFTDGRRLTPALSSGLLPGILRETLLDGGWREATLTPDDLANATHLWMGNALRGLIPARIVPIA